MGIYRLSCRERVVVDTSAFQSLWSELGAGRADRMIGRAMDELVDWLEKARDLLTRRDRAALARFAGELAEVTDRMGLDQLAHAATQVKVVADAGDEVALAAVTARMVRIGDATMAAVWDFQLAHSDG